MECSKRVKSPHGLSRHVKSMHRAAQVAVPAAICVLCSSDLHTTELLQDHLRRAVCHERRENNGNNEAMTDSHVNHLGPTDDGVHEGANEGGDLLFNGESTPPVELRDLTANLAHADDNLDATVEELMADMPNIAPSPAVAQILAQLNILGPYPPAPQPINDPPAILNQQAVNILPAPVSSIPEKRWFEHVKLMNKVQNCGIRLCEKRNDSDDAESFIRMLRNIFSLAGINGFIDDVQPDQVHDSVLAKGQSLTSDEQMKKLLRALNRQLKTWNNEVTVITMEEAPLYRNITVKREPREASELIEVNEEEEFLNLPVKRENTDTDDDASI